MVRPTPDDPLDPPPRPAGGAPPHGSGHGSTLGGGHGGGHGSGHGSASDDNADRWVPSPCTGVCILESADICRGCGRTMDEIVRWSSLDSDERLAVLHAVRERQATR